MATFGIMMGAFVFYHQTETEQEIRTLGMHVLNKVIVVDPGHGGIDGGAQGKSGTLEKDITMEIARKTASLLESSGAKVILTRDDKPNQPDPAVISRQGRELARRVNLAKENQADLYVSIHVNSIPSPKWAGAQTFFEAKSQEGKRLAELIQQELIKQVDDKNHRLARAGDYYVLRTSPCPAALVEVGFVSNPREEKLLVESAYQDKLAKAIWTGICRYLGGDAVIESKNQTKP